MARILVAVDGSLSTVTSLDYTVATARQNTASVHVLFVNTRLVGGRGQTALSRGEAEVLVTTAMAQMVEAGIEVTGSIASANLFDVARIIVDVAAQQHCDTIVMGSQRRRRFTRVLGRGTRERVVSLSPLPVIAAPAPLRVPSRRRADADRGLVFPRGRSAPTRH
jgi:nucleotide-binding universal stress UspA family protein